MQDREMWPKLEPWKVGMAARCPRCGQGKLFKGFLTLRDHCDECGLDYSFADPADGPAFFVICFTCIPAAFVAVWLEVAFEPPFWVHLLVSLPVLLLFCIPPLRPLKGWLVASQYYHDAAEGRLVKKSQGVGETVAQDRPAAADR
ncbi:DUF983 domain-containing protein [Fulvimarina sp. MAC8]|uniref:DUF983 domain-containing protein n=1 Tax=Fulvimarina sp. MAC8 TaxID=3162874 RepID=UPI0032EB58A4